MLLQEKAEQNVLRPYMSMPKKAGSRLSPLAVNLFRRREHADRLGVFRGAQPGQECRQDGFTCTL